MSQAMRGRWRGQRVALIQGGQSRERAISLQTGAAIARALTSRGHDVAVIDWSAAAIGHLLEAPPAVAFLALHGGCGESGELQGLLEMLALPYTGSGVLASALAIDKVRTKALARGAGRPTADWTTLSRADALARAADPTAPPPMPPPFVAKPSADGSSVGVHRVDAGGDWRAALRGALEGRGEVIVERFICGPEVSVAVLDGAALGVCEIQPADGFYDYAAKYERDDTRYLIPTTLGPEVEAEARARAERCYQLLGCRGVARIDFLVEARRDPLLLEVNTLPGMTAASLVPKIAAAAGLDFPSLVEHLLASAGLDSDTHSDT